MSAMIEATGLTMHFGKVEALRGLTISIERGELFALLGPDGAGKTTFFRLVARLLAASGGRVQVSGVRTFGLVPQRFSLYEDLTIDENLHLRARLYDVPDAVARTRTGDLLERVGLDRFRSRLAGALSGGMKQKLALVSALLTQPELLLLDEPTTGVDPVSRREFWILLHQLHHEGLTLVVSTPYMDEAEYASRLAFLDRGRLTAVGTRDVIVGAYPRALVEVRSHDRVALRRRLAKPMGVAGLWARWQGADGEVIISYCLLTVNANNHALLHRYGQPGSEKSMPAILNEGAYDAWLTARPEKAKEFMRQYAAQWLLANPVEKKADKIPKGLLG